jgi:mannosyltransferase OCH1-like enzyme
MGNPSAQPYDLKMSLPNGKSHGGFFRAAPGQLGMRRYVQRLLPVAVAALLVLAFMAGSTSNSMSAYRKTQHHLFPRKIWQTWKVDPLKFEERDHDVAATWIAKNPDYRYEVLTDQNDLAYVETHFGVDGLNRPDIVFMYRELTARIIKADLLRYMIMYVEGGIYTDIDVEAIRPVRYFIPDRWNERDIDMVVGVEIDEPEFSWHPILGPKCMSFCQWTFMCKPRLPVMLTLIETIMNWLRGVALEQKVPIGEIHLDFDQVISGTGPSAFTNAILNEISSRLGHRVTWDTFHGMDESKLVGGVLVLNVEAFAAGQGHSDSGSHETKHAMIRHHYHASRWPTTHPRLNHPVFGEVEQCNWDMECVRTYDRDVEHFKTISPEEKMMQITIKEEQDRLGFEVEARDDIAEKEKEREEEERKREEEEEAGDQ